MRKYLMLATVLFIHNSCVVHKKQHYVLNRYAPLDGSSANGFPQKLEHKIVPNRDSVDEDQAIRPEQEQSGKDELASEIKVLKHKPYFRSVDVFEKAREPNLSDETTEIEKLKPVEKARPGKNKKVETEKKLQHIEKVKQPKNGDHLIYLAASLIGLAVMGLIWTAKKATTKLTRWAKANPKKTQGLMAGLQLPLMGLAVQNGYNLNQLGYEMSDPMLYGLGGATLIGLMSVPFLPERNVIALPKTVNRHRLAYTTIMLSSLMLMVGFGSRIEKDYPKTYLAQTVQAVDQSVFSSRPTIDPKLQQTDHVKYINDRPAKAGISAAGAIILIYLLVNVACAGVCLAVGAFGSVSVLGVIGGILLLFLSIWGIIGVGKARRIRKMQKTQAG